MSVGYLQNPCGPMTLSQWSKARAHKDFEASLQTYQVGAHFTALTEGILIPGTFMLDSILSLLKCVKQLLLNIAPKPTMLVMIEAKRIQSSIDYLPTNCNCFAYNPLSDRKTMEIYIIFGIRREECGLLGHVEACWMCHWKACDLRIIT